MVSIVVLFTIALLATIAPWLSPYELDAIDWDNMQSAPDFASKHYFGTDNNGRDLFIRVLYGTRISLLVGLAATSVSLIIGIAYGAIAGYKGGYVDNVMMRIVDVLYALPFMFFVILLMVFFGRNIVLHQPAPQGICRGSYCLGRFHPWYYFSPYCAQYAGHGDYLRHPDDSASDSN